VAGAIRFLPGSAEALPFPDAAFGAIFSVIEVPPLGQIERADDDPDAPGRCKAGPPPSM